MAWQYFNLATPVHQLGPGYPHLVLERFPKLTLFRSLLVCFSDSHWLCLFHIYSVLDCLFPAPFLLLAMHLNLFSLARLKNKVCKMRFVSAQLSLPSPIPCC